MNNFNYTTFPSFFLCVPFMVLTEKNVYVCMRDVVTRSKTVCWKQCFPTQDTTCGYRVIISHCGFVFCSDSVRVETVFSLMRLLWKIKTNFFISFCYCICCAVHHIKRMTFVWDYYHFWDSALLDYSVLFCIRLPLGQNREIRALLNNFG